jgi:hypothetical protein
MLLGPDLLSSSLRFPWQLCARQDSRSDAAAILFLCVQNCTSMFVSHHLVRFSSVFWHLNFAVCYIFYKKKSGRLFKKRQRPKIGEVSCMVWLDISEVLFNFLTMVFERVRFSPGFLSGSFYRESISGLKGTRTDAIKQKKSALIRL